ncbi:hypothetical protein EON65_59035 [archaeon]|nr:MAG: hypothetical protein EON65_59035 [archaeon]
MDRRQCFVCGEESAHQFIDESRSAQLRARLHDLHHLQAQNDEYRKALEDSLNNENIDKKVLEVEKKSRELHDLQILIKRQEAEIYKKGTCTH